MGNFRTDRASGEAASFWAAGPAQRADFQAGPAASLLGAQDHDQIRELPGDHLQAREPGVGQNLSSAPTASASPIFDS